MILFPIEHLMDEDKCYAFLVELLHPNGLQCPNCHAVCDEARIHRYDRVPLLSYRCPCGCVYNAWTGTLLQGTHWQASIWIQVLRGFTQGTPTQHMAAELGLSRTYLLSIRHKCQDFLAAFSPEGAVAGFNGRDRRNVSERRRKRQKT
jgi:hypothetical protein